MDNLVPFDIDKVKAGWEITNREGHKYRYLESILNDYPHVLVKTWKDGSQTCVCCQDDGQPWGLMLKTKMTTMWLNCYKDASYKNGYYFVPYKTEADAVACADKRTLLCRVAVEVPDV